MSLGRGVARLGPRARRDAAGAGARREVRPLHARSCSPALSSDRVQSAGRLAQVPGPRPAGGAPAAGVEGPPAGGRARGEWRCACMAGAHAKPGRRMRSPPARSPHMPGGPRGPAANATATPSWLGSTPTARHGPAAHPWGPTAPGVRCSQAPQQLTAAATGSSGEAYLITGAWDGAGKLAMACNCHSGEMSGAVGRATCSPRPRSPRVCSSTRHATRGVVSPPAVQRHAAMPPGAGHAPGCWPCPGCWPWPADHPGRARRCLQVPRTPSASTASGCCCGWPTATSSRRQGGRRPPGRPPRPGRTLWMRRSRDQRSSSRHHRHHSSNHSSSRRRSRPRRASRRRRRSSGLPHHPHHSSSHTRQRSRQRPAERTVKPCSTCRRRLRCPSKRLAPHSAPSPPSCSRQLHPGGPCPAPCSHRHRQQQQQGASGRRREPGGQRGPGRGGAAGRVAWAPATAAMARGMARRPRHASGRVVVAGAQQAAAAGGLRRRLQRMRAWAHRAARWAVATPCRSTGGLSRTLR